MKKKPLAFLLGITPNLAFAAGNIALSLRKQMPGVDYDLVVYHTGIGPRDVAAFKSVGRCQLVHFTFPPGFAETLIARSPASSRFRQPGQLMTFCHFEAFNLLHQYHSVVWLDADIAVQASLEHIVRFGPLGITTDAPWTVQNNFSSPIPGYAMDMPGVCAAVMLVQDTLPFRAMHAWLYLKAIEYAKYQINGDQGFINLLLQEFKLIPNLMPLEQWQCISWREEANLARIVHFGTDQKVWSNEQICNAFPEWYRIHREWLELGGSDFDQTKVRPRNILPILNALKTSRSSS